MTPTRRRFIQTLAATALPLPLQAATSPQTLRLGLIADIHKDIIHDADKRLQSFITAMKKQNADAILQLGDFCIPKPANRKFLELFNLFDGPRYHVLGNHDTDGGYTREQAVAFWGMKSRYYSFDLGGFHFIVLDANNKPAGWKGGYPSYIDPPQVDWLRSDLEKTQLNTFVISHQSLERPTCIDNQQQIRTILEAARTRDGKRKVAACLNGHWHLDHHRTIREIPYIHINSASYYWVGGKYQRDRLPADLAKRFPNIKLTIPYTLPLFTSLEINPKAGTFQITACESAWMGPGPDEIKLESKTLDRAWIQPRISAVKRTLI